MHLMDPNETHVEKTWLELHKNDTCGFKQTSHKTAVVRPFTFYLTYHPSKTNKICGAQLEKCSLMDSYTWTFKHWPTSTDLHTSALCRHWMLEDLPGAIDDRDSWWEGAMELCCWCDLMMMVMTYLYMNFILFNDSFVVSYYFFLSAI